MGSTRLDFQLPFVLGVLEHVVHPAVRRAVGRLVAGHLSADVSEVNLAWPDLDGLRIDGLVVVQTTQAVRIAPLVIRRGQIRSVAYLRHISNSPVETGHSFLFLAVVEGATVRYAKKIFFSGNLLGEAHLGGAASVAIALRVLVNHVKARLI